MTKYSRSQPKKLIEVVLPLAKINDASLKAGHRTALQQQLTVCGSYSRLPLIRNRILR